MATREAVGGRSDASRERVAAADPTPAVAADRRRRSGRRRRSHVAPDVPAGLTVSTLVLLAWLPWPIGGHAEWAAALAACATALLLIVWCVVAWRRRLDVAVPVVLLPAALAAVAVIAWSVLQVTPGVLPDEWAHPIWTLAGSYGLDNVPVVSLNRSGGLDALLRLVAAFAMFLLAFALAQTESRARRLLEVLLGVITAYAVFGIIQELVGWRLSGSQGFRSTVVATFVNRNHFATYANLGLLIAMGLLLEPLWLAGRQSAQATLKVRIARALGLIFEERRRVLLAAVVLLLASIGTNSRGGILSLAGAVLFGLLLVLLTSRARAGTKLLVTVASVGTLTAALWLTGDALIERFRSIDTSAGLTEVDGRIAAWQMTLEAIRERPWLGHGHGAYQEIYFLHHPADFRGGVFDHAHNDWLQAAVELGLPAASALWLAIGLVWGACFVGALRRRRRRVFPFVSATAGVLVGLHAIVDFSLLMPAVALTFAALLGIGLAQSQPRLSERP